MENLTNEKLAWLAGLLDSDGSIFIYKRKPNIVMKSSSHSLYVSISNTSEILIDNIILCCGFGYKNKKENKNKKTAFIWRCTDKKALKFLQSVRPFAIQKLNQIEIGIKFGTKKNTINKKAGCNKSDIKQREIDYLELKKMKNKNTLTKLSSHKNNFEFLSWISGLFDGDGCVCIKNKTNRNSYRIECTIICDHEAIVDYIIDCLGFGYKCKQKMKSGLTMFVWSCSGYNCRDLLSLILFNLIAKRKQAELGIEFCNLMGVKKIDDNNEKSRHNLYLKIKEEKNV